MALEFTSDAAGGDAELVITLDLAGLHALLKATETALAAGQADLSSETGEGAPNAFGKVTVRFVGAARDDPESRILN